jgi:hypothetical protein
VISRQLEQLARQRNAELEASVLKAASLRAAAARPAASEPRYRSRRSIAGSRFRTAVGWAIVAIGLRIAESGSRRESVAPALAGEPRVGMTRANGIRPALYGALE